MTPEYRQAIKRMIELQKQQDEKTLRDQKDLEELKKLKEQYKDYKDFKSYKEMQEHFEQEEKKEESEDLKVFGEHMNLVVKDFKAAFKDKAGYKDPVQEDGKTKLTFPSKADAVAFMMAQASKNRAFEVYDLKTNQLVAYSDGTGKLFHPPKPGGAEFKKGEDFTPEAETPKNSPKQ